MTYIGFVDNILPRFFHGVPGTRDQETLYYLSMKREAFYKLVQQALDRIPAKFQAAMKNVAIVVEDRPGSEASELADVEEEGLYGLYLGVPLPERTGEDSGTMPDMIVLYQKPLEEDFPDRKDLIREIEITIVHEVAHFFGFGEEVLEHYGYD